MTEPVLRFGLVGIGRIATVSVAPAIHKIKRAALRAAASRDPTRAAVVGAEVVHESYEKLLRDPTVDAVYIATHNGLHRSLTLNALRNGKHVFCEKPLALNASECAEVIDVAKASRLHLLEGFMYRYHPQIAEVQRLVQNGAVGDLRCVEASFRFLMNNPEDVRLRPEFGGGALLDVGCYCVNASRLFLGERVESVKISPVLDPLHGVDISVQGVLHFGDGRLALISCGFESGLHQGLSLVGTRGVITLNQPFVTSTGSSRLALQVGGQEKIVEMPRVNTFEAELEDFVCAVLDGHEPLLGINEGLLNAKVLDRIAAEIPVQRSALGG